MTEKTKAEQLHGLLGDLPCRMFTYPTIPQCQEMLDKLDKPELDSDHRRILKTLVDGSGCVVYINGEWKWGRQGQLNNWDDSIKAMFKAGLLGMSNVANSGMAKFAFTTDKGREAIE